MRKKYTVIMVAADRMGKLRSFMLSRWVMLTVALGLVLVGVALWYSVTSMLALQEQRDDTAYQTVEDYGLDRALVAYKRQVTKIISATQEMQFVEDKVHSLALSQKDNFILRPMAINEEEIDVMREFHLLASMGEKDFFDSLDEKLRILAHSAEQSELTLSDLAILLEEERLVTLYTPTIWPAHGWLSSKFGFRLSPFTSRQTFHQGIDIAAKEGANVYATARGIVVVAGQKSGYGNLVVIDHGYGYVTKYGHNSELIVSVGDLVDKGDVIAKVGTTGLSTGHHVHYEVILSGIPVDPAQFLIEQLLN